MADFICILTKWICGGYVRWLGSEPVLKQRIYFANHSSHLDFLAVWSALPKNLRQQTRPVAGQDYWDKGILRKYLIRKVFHGVLIDRTKKLEFEDSQHPINIISQVLNKGWSIIIFPEGTRNLDEGIKPFKSGIYHLSQKRQDIELIPVHLENLNRILPKGEFFPVPMLGTVTFGPAMNLEPNETKEAFLERAKNAIERLVAI